MAAMRQRPYLLDSDPEAPFPPTALALREPDGLLAVGGDLSPARLLSAYRNGIFPWYSEGQPILWWSPDPRAVLRTDGVHLASRFRRTLRACGWTLRADTRFAEVATACAHADRPGQRGTWITPEMHAAYVRLHALGHAHSIEVLDGDRLVGGLYGVAVGRMFYGESMFSAVSGGSKAALAGLARYLDGHGWPLIDAQVENPHLMRMGAQRWPRDAFVARVAALAGREGRVGSWTADFGDLPAASLAAPRTSGAASRADRPGD